MSNQNRISIWANIRDGEYNDKKVLETDTYTIWNYCGQRTHRDDHLICKNALFFLQLKKNAPRIYQGIIIHYDRLLKNAEDGSYRYIIIVSKDENTGRSFQIKKDAFDFFGLEGGNIVSGIIKHKN